MIIEIQVHPCGTAVLIDRDAGTIGTKYPPSPVARETYSLTDDWVKPFTVCRFCGKEVDDTHLAWAYWKLQQDVCGVECFGAEELKRRACCEQATRLGCVCAYATTCPVHGERHFGTHD